MDDPSRGLDTPPLHLTAAFATTAYDADGLPVTTQLGDTGITEGVALSASFRLFFDRFLFPAAATRQAICLRPSTDPVNSTQGCLEPSQPFTAPEYDPVLRAVTYRLPPGERLLPDTLYRLTVFQQIDPNQPGLIAFDGVPLETSYAFDFRTQPAGGAERDELGPSRERYCASILCFDACFEAHEACLEACADAACRTACESDKVTCNAACEPLCVLPRDTCVERRGSLHFDPRNGMFETCASAGCHSPGTTQQVPDAPFAMGLDLASEPAIAATAIGRTAHQTQQGQEAQSGDLNPLRFGRAMPLIDPGNPGNSYLLYKLIVHPLNHPHQGGVIDAQLAAAIQQLRNSVVAGLPMPAATSQADKSLSPDEDPAGVDSFARLQQISFWIAHGAAVSCP